MALDIRQSVFGGNNLFVAIACEDLAYASYVYEYSSGKFNDARCDIAHLSGNVFMYCFLVYNGVFLMRGNYFNFCNPMRHLHVLSILNQRDLQKNF